MNCDNLLKIWCAKKGYYTKGSNYTHLLLDGGKLNIPNSDIDTFFKYYELDISNNHNLFVCELKTNVFKLFLDIDLLDDHPLNINDILPFINNIQQSIKQLYSKDYDAYVCMAPHKEIIINNINYFKTGIHLIWPAIFTNKFNSNISRNHIVTNLSESFIRPAFDPWHKVIDDSVFKGNGLRMLYSKKVIKCNLEHSDSICSKCNNTYKIIEDRSYKPYIIHNLNNTITVNDSIINNIKNCTIQSFDNELTPLNQSLINNIKSLKIKKISEPSKEDILGLNSINFKQLINNPTLISKLQTHVRKIFPSEFKSINIIDLHSCSNGSYFVCRTNSQFCMNINNKHKSNTIYLYIDKNNIYQKCFCRCDTLVNRVSGYCKDYRSTPFPLNKVIQKQLFPTNKNTNTSEITTISNLTKNKTNYINSIYNYLEYLENSILTN